MFGISACYGNNGRSLALFLMFAVSLVSPARADDQLQLFLEAAVSTEREKHRIPGIAALIQIDGKIVAEVAQGVRANGRTEQVTSGDRWHIGSDTKAITATLIGRLAEQNLLSFDETLAAAFPAFAEDMHPDYRDVTIAQLLHHTAGLTELADDKERAAFRQTVDSVQGVVAQRAAVARKYLMVPPAFKPGKTAHYSNVGYIIAGAIAEARTGKPWESLVQEQIFAPLGIVDAGFGAPGSAEAIDQPRGHRERSGVLEPLDPSDPAADNRPVVGPAGTISIGLHAWLRFAQDHLDGVHGHGKLLKAETYRRLHTPYTSGTDVGYAMGWSPALTNAEMSAYRRNPTGTPTVLGHNGSNGFWYAAIRIWPKRDIICLLAMNRGGDKAAQAATQITKAVSDRLKAID